MSITAMKQALEALEYEASRGNDDAYRIQREALRTAIAEAEKQETWEQFYPDMGKPVTSNGMPAYEGPLSAAQRQWVGLTDEEILSDDILRYYYGMNGGAGPVSQKGKKVVAAIEAKLKEKNT